MPQFKKIFGPLVFVLSFSNANGWAEAIKDKAGAIIKPGITGETVFIPLSNRNPAAMQPGSSYSGGGVYNQPATIGVSPKVAESKRPTTGNRFWAPPPDFEDSDSVDGGVDGIDGGVQEWSSTPPPSVGWGSIGTNKPRMAKENDPRFDYSEPDNGPDSLNIYKDYPEPNDQFLKGSRDYEFDRWQDGGSDQSGAGSYVWGGDPLNKPKSKKYDQFDYTYDDHELPKQKRSNKNYYNTLEPPPQGTYGNQWR
ncbi:MAG: hypothetical protein HQL71_15580 [Magnetococcales bacterium]|nr:hypothetical protein [Magnetococcales bacterium]